MSKQTALDHFGRLIMSTLRDAAIDAWDRDARPKDGDGAAAALPAALSRLSALERDAIRAAVIDAIDAGVHSLLFALQEQGDLDNRVRITVDRTNVITASDGLQGEPFGPAGWQARFSHHPRTPDPVVDEVPLEYHPTAREQLPDPFFWERDEPFAPHGNAVGDLLLDALAEYLADHPSAESAAALRVVIAGGSPFEDTIDAESPVPTEMFQALVAGAFACVKLRGACPSSLHAQVLARLQQERARIAENHRQWPLWGARLQSLDLMARRLRDCATS